MVSLLWILKVLAFTLYCKGVLDRLDYLSAVEHIRGSARYQEFKYEFLAVFTVEISRIQI